MVRDGQKRGAYEGWKVIGQCAGCFRSYDQGEGGNRRDVGWVATWYLVAIIM